MQSILSGSNSFFWYAAFLVHIRRSLSSQSWHSVLHLCTRLFRRPNKNICTPYTGRKIVRVIKYYCLVIIVFYHNHDKRFEVSVKLWLTRGLRHKLYSLRQKCSAWTRRKWYYFCLFRSMLRDIADLTSWNGKIQKMQIAIEWFINCLENEVVLRRIKMCNISDV